MSAAVVRVTPRQREVDALAADIAMGHVSLFVGAGLSTGAGLVGWTGLLREAGRRLGVEVRDLAQRDPLAAASHIEEKTSPRRFRQEVAAIVSAHRGPARVHALLARLPWRAIFTTNFDDLIELALDAARRHFDPIRHDEEVGAVQPQGGTPVVKFHGDIEWPPGLVLTRQDYATYRARHPALTAYFEAALATSSFLFVGFSLRDPNFLALDADVQRAVGCYRRRPWVVLPADEARRIRDDADHLGHYRILSVSHKRLPGFVEALFERAAELSAERAGEATAAIVAARDALAARVRRWPAELVELSAAALDRRPRCPAPLRTLAADVVSTARMARAFGLDDAATWRRIGVALYHLEMDDAAVGALVRAAGEDETAARALARCHWYRGDPWRVRRVVERLVARRGAVRLFDERPTDALLLGASTNHVALQHLLRGRRALALRLLRALRNDIEAWLDDPVPPAPHPPWFWRYLYHHLARALLLAVDPLRPNPDLIERARSYLVEAGARRGGMWWAQRWETLAVAATWSGELGALRRRVARAGHPELLDAIDAGAQLARALAAAARRWPRPAPEDAEGFSPTPPPA